MTVSPTIALGCETHLTSSATAGGPCGAANSACSLSSAQYSQTFGYDTLDRLTSGPLGSYTYGDSAHLHAVTGIGPSGAPTYTASYDVAGNMACRAPDATTTYAGTTPTGAQLADDPAGRLASWSGGTTTDSFLYDGEGNRVAQLVTVNGSSATLTKYFAGANGLPTAERIGTVAAYAEKPLAIYSCMSHARIASGFTRGRLLGALRRDVRIGQRPVLESARVL